MRRLLVAAAILVAGLAWASPAAWAHANLARSDPADGAQLDRPPPALTLTFTEQPDVSISSVRLLDSSGRAVSTGPLQALPGQVLRATVSTLGSGSYTVSWRVVSRTDGHVTAGSFSFGVGVPAQAPVSSGSAASTPRPKPLAVLGRWATFLGIAVTLSAAVVGVAVFGGRLPGPSAAVLGTAWAVSAFGIGARTLAKKSQVGVSFSGLFRSGTGHELLTEVAAVGLLGVGVLLAVRVRRRWALPALGVAAALVTLAHVRGSHAAAASDAGLEVTLQWVHVAAVASWTGGLLWLSLGLRGGASLGAARRYSTLAGACLATAVVSGVVRSINELGGVSHVGRLTTTGYGETLIVKLALFALLVALGARNRMRHLRHGAERALRRLVGAEVALAVGIFGVTGVLTELPPAANAATSRPAVTHVVVAGADFATTTRVRLTVTPGTVGRNRFDAQVTDYDSGRATAATRVALRFTRPDRPDIGEATLELQRRAGTKFWAASGSQLSIEGRWTVTVIVQTPSTSVEIPLAVETRLPPQKIDIVRTPGAPTLYTVRLPDGRSLQTYLDPGRPGSDDVHATAFDRGGTELPLSGIEITVTSPEGVSTTLEPRRFGPGHFVSTGQFTKGRWQVSITATAEDGSALPARLTVPIPTG